MLLVNPISGNQKSKMVVEEEAVPVLSAAGLDLVVRETEYKRHCTELARGIAKGEFTGVATCGGDGFIQECVNGLLANADGSPRDQRTLFAALPGGTDNAFIASLDYKERTKSSAIAATIHRTLIAIVKGKPKQIDVMRCQGQCFFCVLLCDQVVLYYIFKGLHLCET